MPAALLDAREESWSVAWERAGLPRSQARVLAALARGPATAAGLAEATTLARQDAAAAARALEGQGILVVEKLASGGRPALRYRLAPDGLRRLLDARRAAIAGELRALDEMAAQLPDA